MRLLRRLLNGRPVPALPHIDESERAELERRYARTHPPEHRGLTGCCDHADPGRLIDTPPREDGPLP